MFWGGYGATNPKISFANLDGSGGGDLNTGAATVSEPFGLAIDIATNRILWANDSGNKISFARLDGSGGGDLNTGAATVNNPEGIAIDPGRGKVYWANGSGNKISFANLDGSGGGGDLNTGGATVDSPEGVAVDPAAGRIYWANNSGNSIAWVALNNSGVGENLNSTGATVNSPEGVALDLAHGRIFWANNTGNKISFARLDGSGGADLNTTGATANQPLGLGVDPDAGRVYWANDGGNKISFARLDNTGGGGDLNTSGATVDGPAFATLLKAPTGAGAPAVTGRSVPGSTLSCSQGSWSGDLLGEFLFKKPQSLAYQWTRNGAAIPGATGATFLARTTGDYRCTVTAANQAGTSSQTSAPHAVLIASLSRLAINPRSFLAAGSGPSARSIARRKTGGKVSFRLNEAATVTFKVRRRARGRRGRRGRCVRPTRGNRKKRRCTRLVTLRGSFTRAGKAGRNSFRFTGRLRRRKLKPARYLLVGTPKADGKAGRPRSTSFRIKRPPRRRRARRG